MTPDHKALCDRLLAPWFTNGCAEYQREAAEAIAALSAREAAYIDTIARLTAERDAVQAVTVEACAVECEKWRDFRTARGDEVGYDNIVTGADDCAKLVRTLATIPPHVAAARVLIPVLDQQHIDKMTSLGRDPSKYDSEASFTARHLRAIATQGDPT